MNKKLDLARPAATTWIAIAIFCFAFVVFARSKVHQVTDSSYSMLLSQSLIEHGSFKLDNYALPRLEPMNRGYYTSDGTIYQLELANNHLYYHLPPGSSVLSVPYVALLRLFGIKATNADGTYSPAGETKIEVSLAALLMAALAVIFFHTARLRLPTLWSAIVALGATFGTQSLSTASRALWTDTWGIVLVGTVVFLLLAHETGKRSLNPVILASLLAWAYFVRPTNTVHILAVTVYLLIYHRKLFIAYALTGAAWLALFILYSWHNYRHVLPSYYGSNRLNFSVFWTALAGNLISPARGLLVHVPVLLFVGYLLARYWRHVKLPRLAVLSLAIIVGHLIAISGFSHWWGGHSFGARFTTGLLPWLVLLAILGIEALLAWRRQRQEANQPARWNAQLIAGGALLVVSMFINARGAMSHKTWTWNARPIGVDEYPAKLWDWREPQFLVGIVRSPLPQKFPPVAGQIDFSTADSDKYLWSGWANREDGLRRTNGTEAALIFGVNPVSDMLLEIKLSPLLVKGKMSEQRVQVILNGQQIETLVLKDEKASEYKLLLPKNQLRDNNVLIFGLPDASSPGDYGISDGPQQLGIAIYWMQLQPHQTSQQNISME
jgi:hypothetical protein